MTDPDLRDPNVDRAYREAPRDEPPPELDERIRAAARRAVDTRPRSLEQQASDERRRSWASRWRVPLSVAATLVIAATLTVMVQEEERRPRDDAGRGASPMIVAPREAEKPAPPASAPDAAAARAPGSTPAPAAPASVTTPPSAEPAPKLEQRARSVEVEAPAAAPPAAPAPVPAPPAQKAVPQTAPAGAASEALRRDRNLGDRPERASREAAPSAIRTPEAWVEHVRNLRLQGREAEATAELVELRRAYPDFQLPPDLAR